MGTLKDKLTHSTPPSPSWLVWPQYEHSKIITDVFNILTLNVLIHILNCYNKIWHCNIHHFNFNCKIDTSVINTI
jgi:hypothetical protein